MYPCGWNTPKITVFWGRLNEPYENLSLDSELVVDLEICPFKVTFFVLFFFLTPISLSNSEMNGLTLPRIMVQNGQTYFKNLAVFRLQDFLSMFGHFAILCLKWLKVSL